MFTSEPGNEDVEPRSQATLAYRTIRGDILSGRHVPDKKLKVQDLAEELQVSPGAVREALSRLVSEQLVISYDQRGFAVAPLSIPDLRDLTELRCEIEAIALRRSIELGDVNWEAGLLGAAHRLRSTPMRLSGKKGGANPDWLVIHRAFHAALIAACGSARLRALHAQLYEQAERYRLLSGAVDTSRDVAKEHQEILDLALARDAKRLIDVVQRHLRTTTQLIIDGTAKPASRPATSRRAARSRSAA